ncbi:hypothetical protein ABZT30_53940, partial [Streptomyces mirabilis]
MVAVRVDADEAVVEGAEVLLRGQRAGRIQRLGLGGGRPGDTEGAAAVGGEFWNSIGRIGLFGIVQVPVMLFVALVMALLL